MKFMMTYAFGSDVTEGTVDRFLSTGAPAPEGVTLLGRWHAAAGRCGFLLLESDDASALFRYSAEWRDLLDLELYPVVDDEMAGQVLGSLQQG